MGVNTCRLSADASIVASVGKELTIIGGDALYLVWTEKCCNRGNDGAESAKCRTVDVRQKLPARRFIFQTVLWPLTSPHRLYAQTGSHKRSVLRGYH